MKITDSEVIKHLKENYFIRRENWKKDTGLYHDHYSFRMLLSGFMDVKGLKISLEDLEADDWILCPKE